MRESCTSGSARGASSNGGPYRNREANEVVALTPATRHLSEFPVWVKNRRLLCYLYGGFRQLRTKGTMRHWRRWAQNLPLKALPFSTGQV